jgi:hypothetical protein
MTDADVPNFTTKAKCNPLAKSNSPVLCAFFESVTDISKPVSRTLVNSRAAKNSPYRKTFTWNG